MEAGKLAEDALFTRQVASQVLGELFATEAELALLCAHLGGVTSRNPHRQPDEQEG